MTPNENEKIEKNFIDRYFLKKKYLQAPTIYKILYDKYIRKDVHKFIIDKTIFEIANENLKSNPKFLKFSEEDESDPSYQTENFSELLILTFYDHLHKEKILAYTLCMITMVQYVIYKMHNSLKWENKKFIFLDNNRMIMNKICSFNIFLSVLMKYNLFILTGFTIYASCKYLTNKYGNNVEEEIKEVEDNYKRSMLLYSKIKF